LVSPLLLIAIAIGFPPMKRAPRYVREAMSINPTVPSVWLATKSPPIGRDGTAARLGSHRDLRHDLEAVQAGEVDDRDGATHAVRDVGLIAAGVQRDATGLDADGDLRQLHGGVELLAQEVAHSEDGEAVGFAVDDDQQSVIFGKGDRGRPAWREERGRIGTGSVEEQAADE
jgi:hypothetical protein